MTELYQTLLGMLAGGQPATAARSKLMEVLSAQEGMDPRMRALLSQAMTSGAEGEQPDTFEEPDAADATRRQRLTHSLRRRFLAIRQELKRLRVHNAELAAALGACRRCWGDDPDCAVCSGTGGPGTFALDHRRFTELVEPALRVLRARRERLVRMANPQGQEERRDRE